MRQKVLDMMVSRGMLLHPLAAEHILSQGDPLAYAEDVLGRMDECPLVLTAEFLREMDSSRGPASVTLEAPQSAVTAPASTVSETLTVAAPGPQQPEAYPSVLEQARLAPTVAPSVEAALGLVPSPVEFSAGAAVSPHAQTQPLKPEPRASGVKTRRAPAADYPANVTVLRDISGNSTIESSVRGFAEYFNDRFDTLRRMLRAKREFAGAIDIRSLRRSTGQVKFIGMVNEVRTTKNGNKMLVMEDESGETARVIITADKPLFHETILTDEVIGIAGKVGRDSFVLAESVARPDIPGMRVPNKAPVDICAAFISDIHVGSKTFLPEQWDRFVAWLREGEGVAGKIRYLVVAGDVVDGIGVYPNQDAELEITEIHEQYEALARRMSGLPDHIRVVMLPGNHDSVRPSEPQPTFSEPVRKILRTADMQFLGNPSLFALDGVQVLAYHGKSFDDFISHFPGMSYSAPMPVMKEMLRRRHLAPMYGAKTPIAPEKKDHLLIDTIPDIFVTGHVHSLGMEVYKGIVLINASTWQSQTSYQVMHNFNPVPAKVPIVNLHTGEWSVENFL